MKTIGYELNKEGKEQIIKETTKEINDTKEKKIIYDKNWYKTIQTINGLPSEEEIERNIKNRKGKEIKKENRIILNEYNSIFSEIINSKENIYKNKDKNEEAVIENFTIFLWINEKIEKEGETKGELEGETYKKLIKSEKKYFESKIGNDEFDSLDEEEKIELRMALVKKYIKNLEEDEIEKINKDIEEGWGKGDSQPEILTELTELTKKHFNKETLLEEKTSIEKQIEKVETLLEKIEEIKEEKEFFTQIDEKSDLYKYMYINKEINKDIEEFKQLTDNGIEDNISEEKILQIKKKIKEELVKTKEKLKEQKKTPNKPNKDFATKVDEYTKKEKAIHKSKGIRFRRKSKGIYKDEETLVKDYWQQREGNKLLKGIEGKTKQGLKVIINEEKQEDIEIPEGINIKVHYSKMINKQMINNLKKTESNFTSAELINAMFQDDILLNEPNILKQSYIQLLENENITEEEKIKAIAYKYFLLLNPNNQVSEDVIDNIFYISTNDLENNQEKKRFYELFIQNVTEIYEIGKNFTKNQTSAKSLEDINNDFNKQINNILVDEVNKEIEIKRYQKIKQMNINNVLGKINTTVLIKDFNSPEVSQERINQYGRLIYLIIEEDKIEGIFKDTLSESIIKEIEKEKAKGTNKKTKIKNIMKIMEDTSLNNVEKVFTRKGYREINDDKNTQEDIKSVFLEMKRPKKLTNKNLRRNLIRNKIKSVGEEGERTDVIKTNTLKGFYERIIEKSFKLSSETDKGFLFHDILHNQEIKEKFEDQNVSMLDKIRMLQNKVENHKSITEFGQKEFKQILKNSFGNNVLKNEYLFDQIEELKEMEDGASKDEETLRLEEELKIKIKERDYTESQEHINIEELKRNGTHLKMIKEQNTLFEQKAKVDKEKPWYQSNNTSTNIKKKMENKYDNKSLRELIKNEKVNSSKWGTFLGKKKDKIKNFHEDVNKKITKSLFAAIPKLGGKIIETGIGMTGGIMDDIYEGLGGDKLNGKDKLLNNKGMQFLKEKSKSFGNWSYDTGRETLISEDEINLIDLVNPFNVGISAEEVMLKKEREKKQKSYEGRKEIEEEEGKYMIFNKMHDSLSETGNIDGIFLEGMEEKGEDGNKIMNYILDENDDTYKPNYSNFTTNKTEITRMEKEYKKNKANMREQYIIKMGKYLRNGKIGSQEKKLKVLKQIMKTLGVPRENRDIGNWLENIKEKGIDSEISSLTNNGKLSDNTTDFLSLLTGDIIKEGNVIKEDGKVTSFGIEEDEIKKLIKNLTNDTNEKLNISKISRVIEDLRSKEYSEESNKQKIKDFKENKEVGVLTEEQMSEIEGGDPTLTKQNLLLINLIQESDNKISQTPKRIKNKKVTFEDKKLLLLFSFNQKKDFFTEEQNKKLKELQGRLEVEEKELIEEAKKIKEENYKRDSCIIDLEEDKIRTRFGETDINKSLKLHFDYIYGKEESVNNKIRLLEEEIENIEISLSLQQLEDENIKDKERNIIEILEKEEEIESKIKSLQTLKDNIDKSAIKKETKSDTYKGEKYKKGVDFNLNVVLNKIKSMYKGENQDLVKDFEEMGISDKTELGKLIAIITQNMGGSEWEELNIFYKNTNPQDIKIFEDNGDLSQEMIKKLMETIETTKIIKKTEEKEEELKQEIPLTILTPLQTKHSNRGIF